MKPLSLVLVKIQDPHYSLVIKVSGLSSSQAHHRVQESTRRAQ